MELIRDEVGQWFWTDEIQPNCNPHYYEAIHRYTSLLDKVFFQAKDKSEFDFLLTMFRVRGYQEAGWDPFEITISAIKSICKLNDKSIDTITHRHLQLWIYGHIVEASEPYAILNNLLDIIQGNSYLPFRLMSKGKLLSPGEKIKTLLNMASRAGIPEVISPLQKIWDRHLRNAIFHSDYSLYGNKIRIMSPTKEYSREHLSILANRTLAYIESIWNLCKVFISQYKNTVVIQVPPYFSNEPQVQAVES